MRSNFPPALYANYEVKKLTARQHDELLANGWFRNDVHVFTSSIKFLGVDWRSCVMLRIPLENFSWKKRLRKLIRRNSGEFDVLIRPFRHTPEKEKLWQWFKKEVHGWTLIPQLDKHLLRNASPVHFNTWELCVYKNSELVAFSIFDQGEKSISSLEAAYNVDFQRYSLGVYTMLMEIHYAILNGLKYYYPGFYPRDVPMFDYKLRPGHVEFFRLKERLWLPLEQLSQSDWLKEVILSKYQEARTMLTGHGYNMAIGYGMYPSIPSGNPSPSDYNVLLVIKKPNQFATQFSCMIGWDPVGEYYQVFSGNPLCGTAFWQKESSTDTLRLLHINPSGLVGTTSNLSSLPELVLKALK